MAVQVVVRALEADYERVAELVEVRRVDPPRAAGANLAKEERVRLILDGAERDRSVAVSGRRLLRAAGRCRGDRARPVDRHGEGIGQAGAARVANGQPQLGVVGAEPGGDVPACPEKPTPVPRPDEAVRTPPAARDCAKRNACARLDRHARVGRQNRRPRREGRRRDPVENEAARHRLVDRLEVRLRQVGRSGHVGQAETNSPGGSEIAPNLGQDLPPRPRQDAHRPGRQRAVLVTQARN